MGDPTVTYPPTTTLKPTEAWTESAETLRDRCRIWANMQLCSMVDWHCPECGVEWLDRKSLKILVLAISDKIYLIGLPRWIWQIYLVIIITFTSLFHCHIQSYKVSQFLWDIFWMLWMLALRFWTNFTDVKGKRTKTWRTVASPCW